MRPCNGADDVISGVNVGHPVAHRFVHRVLESARARRHWHHCRTKQAHTIDVHLLALDVISAHIDDAL